MKGRGKIFLVTAGLLLMSLLTAVAFAAPSTTKVSTFDQFQAALEDQKTTRIEFAADIEMDAPVYMDAGKSGVTIDGKGYALTATDSIYFTTENRKVSIAISDLTIAYSGEDAFFMEENDGKRDAQMKLCEVNYRGGSLISSSNAEISLEDCTMDFDAKAGAGRFIRAKAVVIIGETNISDDYAANGAPVIAAQKHLLFKDDAACDVNVKAKEPDTAACYGEAYFGDASAALVFEKDSKVLLGRVKDVSITYEGLDLCTHEHDEDCDPDEDGICPHVCADEKYACCMNVLVIPEGVKFAPADSYDGHFEVSIRYLDGKIVELKKLSDITYDKLCGAVRLNVRYTAPDTVDVSGKIVWNDDKNKYDTRPDSVKVVLYRNGVKTDERLTVKKSKFTFTDMPYQDENGSRYNYTVRLAEDLKPLYTTAYDDKTNTITNKLVWYKVTVKHVDARTGDLIVPAEKHKIPHGKTFTAELLDPEEYPQYELADKGVATAYKNVKGDLTITFKYNEMIRFAGTHSFAEDAHNKNTRFGNMTLRIYRNIPNEDGTIPQDPGTMLDDVIDITTNGEDFTQYETLFAWRKYDDNGTEYIYTLVVVPETPHYTQEFIEDEKGNINIVSTLGNVNVKVIYAYYKGDDPNTKGEGGEVMKSESFTRKFGVSLDEFHFPQKMKHNGADVYLSGICAKCAEHSKHAADNNGKGTNVKGYVADADVQITVTYVDKEAIKDK